MLTVSRAAAISCFRSVLLAGLDRAASLVFAGSPQVGRDPGAIDADLGPLFRVLDAHVETLATRFGAQLTAGDEGDFSITPDYPGLDVPSTDLAWMLREEFDICGERYGNLPGDQARAELASLDRVVAWVVRAGFPPEDVTALRGLLPNAAMRDYIAGLPNAPGEPGNG